MARAFCSALALVASLGLGGCSLVVDFDRSLLVDAGVDGGFPDASIEGLVDAGGDMVVDPAPRPD